MSLAAVNRFSSCCGVALVLAHYGQGIVCVEVIDRNLNFKLVELWCLDNMENMVPHNCLLRY